MLGDESLLTEELVATLNEVTFISGLEWLHGANALEDETAIGRLVVIVANREGQSACAVYASAGVGVANVGLSGSVRVV